MENKITNWSDLYKDKDKLDSNVIYNEKLYNKTYENHYIKSKNVLALLISPSGGGKTTTIIDFIMRTKNDKDYIPFYNIVYFTASTSDEDLIKMLKKIAPSTKIIDDINKLPLIEDYKNDIEFNKKLKNIIIFDDINNLPLKKKDILNNWINSGRKIFSHIFFLAQNYTDIPMNIRRNANYIFIYRQRENTVVDRILKKHNIYNIDIEELYKFYYNSTKEKGQFLLLDLTDNSDKRIRANFLDVLF